ncbi:MAG: 3-deoxy-manno-octulosonate cytidylyltransferase [Gemmatimonadaceae bacterium]|nr:3-deoxy-manno-octulosonate cytidylyltransferase [Gemmatimonadaceae bacterium]
MRTLAVIPARLGATRLPRKPLRLLAGLPLVVRVWERVRDTGLAERCVVATDSDEVAQAVQRHGGDAVMTSPDHLSGTDRVAEVAARAEFAAYDTVLNVQGDEPFVAVEALNGAVDMVEVHGFPLGTAAAMAGLEVLQDPNVVKVVAADDGRAMYFSRAAIPFLRDRSDAALLRDRIWRHVGVYAYSRDALARWVALPPHPLERVERLEQLRPLAAGLAMGVARIADAASSGIDTEDDLTRANVEWTNTHPGTT